MMDLQQFPWLSGSGLHTLQDNKHSPPFAKDFPLLLRFYALSVDLRHTPRYHDYLEITYIAEGEGTLHVGNQSHSIQTGDIFLISSQEFHALETKPSQGVKIICFYFLPELIYQRGVNSFDFSYLKPFYDRSLEQIRKIPVQVLGYESYPEWIDPIYQELRSQKEAYRLVVKNHVLDILTRIVRYYSQELPQFHHKHIQLKEAHKLEPVFHFLQNHYCEKVTLSDVSSLANMSPSYFCRVFKKLTGTSLTDFILRMRIDKAKELLLKDETTITQIAFEVGFESHSYFDRIFRRYVHISPKDFLQQARV